MGTLYSHVTATDRMSIQALLQAKLSGSTIARKLNFCRSTIHHEINRNKATPMALASSYQAGVAQARSRANQKAGAATRPRLGSDTNLHLWRTVLGGLGCSWLPQQIAGKLPRMNKAAIQTGLALPAQPISISLDTIYCAIYSMPRNALRTELVGLLRKCHKARLPRTHGTARKGALPNMTSTSCARPRWLHASCVHWECDLIKGAMNRSSVGTLVESLSRYTMLAKLDGNTAQDVLEGFKRRLKSIPESLRKTVTDDQGSEMGVARDLECPAEDGHLLLRPAQPVAARRQRER